MDKEEKANVVIFTGSLGCAVASLRFQICVILYAKSARGSKIWFNKFFKIFSYLYTDGNTSEALIVGLAIFSSAVLV